MPENQGMIWDKNPQPVRRCRFPLVERFFDILYGQGPDIYVGWIGGNSASASGARRGGSGGSTGKKSTSGRNRRRDASSSRYRGKRRETINSLVWWVVGCPAERGGYLRRRNGGPGVGGWSGVEILDGVGGRGFEEEQDEEEQEEKEEEEEEEERGLVGFLWNTLSRRARDERQVIPKNDEDHHAREYPALRYHEAMDENEGTALIQDAPGRRVEFLWSTPSRRTSDERHAVPQRYEDRHGREYPALRYDDAVDGNEGTALMWYVGPLTRCIRRLLGF